MPIPARATGDVWLHAFEHAIMPALEAYQPAAIVLQLGTDTHYLDPLGHIRSTAQEWLAAVKHVRDLGLPLVAVGGGGYNLTTVPRMWVAAALEWGRIAYDDRIPEDLATLWDMPSFTDHNPPGPAGFGAAEVESVIDWLQANHLPNIPRR